MNVSAITLMRTDTKIKTDSEVKTIFRITKIFFLFCISFWTKCQPTSSQLHALQNPDYYKTKQKQILKLCIHYPYQVCFFNWTFKTIIICISGNGYKFHLSKLYDSSLHKTRRHSSSFMTNGEVFPTSGISGHLNQ